MDFVVEYKDCCGCGACHEVCPKSAISMKTDECGYVYASIDSGLCIDCGKCRSVCPAIKNDYEKDFVKKYNELVKEVNKILSIKKSYLIKKDYENASLYKEKENKLTTKINKLELKLSKEKNNIESVSE